MKKDKTKTHGYTLTKFILGAVCFFALLYLKWYICDRENEIDNRQTQEMVDYQSSRGHDINVYE